MSESDTLHLGLVYPGGGPEADFYRFEQASGGRARVFLSNSQFAVVNGSDHHPDALRQTAQISWIFTAARRLSILDLDVLVWACTSGSFVNGRDYAEKQTAEISKAVGVPTTSTSLGFGAVLQRFHLSEVALLSTYPWPATELFVNFLEEYEVGVRAQHYLGKLSGWQSATMDYDDIRQHVANLDLNYCEALLIPDTALSSLHWVDHLEFELRIPVLSANAVSLWYGQIISGKRFPVSGLGRLLGGLELQDSCDF